MLNFEYNSFYSTRLWIQLNSTYIYIIWSVSGLEMAGIYRLSGSVSQIQKLRIQANQCKLSVLIYSVRCCHIICYFLNFLKLQCEYCINIILQYSNNGVMF